MSPTKREEEEQERAEDRQPQSEQPEADPKPGPPGGGLDGVPNWGWAMAVGVALVLGLGIGGALGASEEQSLKDDVSTLKDELGEAEAKTAKAEGEAERAQDGAPKAQAPQAQGEAKPTEVAVPLESFGDGIWKVGTDFQPGVYRSPGGSGCYWALLNSADSMDIVNKGGFEANQTLEIDSAWFESSGCGEWERIE